MPGEVFAIVLRINKRERLISTRRAPLATDAALAWRISVGARVCAPAETGLVDHGTLRRFSVWRFRNGRARLVIARDRHSQCKLGVSTYLHCGLASVLSSALRTRPSLKLANIKATKKAC